jgi:rod shape-determining protein MreC
MIVQSKKNRPRGGLLILIGICLFLMLLSYFSPSFNSAVRNGINSVLLPMQRGMNKAGSYIFNRIQALRDLQAVQEKNKLLEEELAELRQENAHLKLTENELKELRTLLKMKEQYPEYETLGAHVIGKSSGNWFQSFMIDKGSRDGIQLNMNVMAGGGLVGLVTAVGDGYATVTTIINSGQYVSAMSARSGSNCMVAGDLTLYSDGLLRLENISLSSDVLTGDKIVTSNISDKYLPGLLIGYVETLETDANQLTQTGTLRPAADFDNLNTVLVFLALKETGNLP